MCHYIDYCTKNRKRLLNRFRKFIGNYEDAFDLYQDLLLALLEKPPIWKGTGDIPPEGYIAGYIDEHLKWICMNHNRVRRDEFSLDVEDEDEESRIDRLDLTFAQLHDGQLEGCSDPSLGIDRERLVREVSEKLSSIANPLHREVLESLLLSGTSVAGLSKALGISPGSVRAIMHRFKKGDINETNRSRGSGG